MRDRFTIYRALPLAGILGLSFLVSVGLAVLNEFYIDDILCICFVDIIFWFVFLYEVEFERKHGKIGEYTETNFTRIFFGVLWCCAITFILSSYEAEYFKAFMLLPIIMYAYSNEAIATSMSIYFCVIFGVITGCNATELICYISEVILVIGLCRGFYKKELRVYFSLFVLALSFITPTIFYYWAYKEIQPSNYLFAIANTALSSLFIFFLFYKKRTETIQEERIRLADMINDDFPLVREEKAYSMIEYQHSKRVSKICYLCAQHLGFDKDLCAAAGFYYRMGRWEGEPFVENGVKKAQKHCFPTELTVILSEYYGEKKLPSTPESALVHMVDALIKKMELFEKNVGSSKWNREVLIYQTLNEYSSEGLYDESKLTMNQFIKLRDYLTKEEDLL